MAKLTCSNAACKTVFSIEGKEVGDTVHCPKCSTPCTVLAEFGTDFDIETFKPQEPGKSIHHPARQICSNCGAVLGVRAATCPYCKADVRTGKAVKQQAVVKKRNWLPLFIAAGGALVVVILIVVLLAVLKK